MLELLPENMKSNNLPTEIFTIKSAIAPLRNQLLNHEVYQEIRRIEDLQVFMEHHLFAVWDFMSVLKALQNEFTCTTIPWVPKGNPKLRRLINEIVHGEESDLGNDGRIASHYELYLEAMELAGAQTSKMNAVLNAVRAGLSVKQAMQANKLPKSIQDFVEFTFQTIESGQTHAIASIFTFGREDLIPDMFTALVTDLNKAFPGKLDSLIYYLERHIELDGDEHGPLALTMVAELCGNNAQKWVEAEVAAKKAIEVRIGLWDGILEEIVRTRLRAPAIA